MRKIGLFITILALVLGNFSALAQENLVAVDTLSLPVDYDQKTDSLFINGIDTEAVKGNSTTLYINGFNCGSQDVIRRDGKFYITESILEEKLNMTLSENGILEVVEKETEKVEILPDKTYAIINCQSGKAFTNDGNNLYTSDYTNAENQRFKILDSGIEGFYHIRTVKTNRNLDVYNHWTDPGVQIIVWDVGGGDNQKFSIEFTEGGCYITARGRQLPIDEYGEGIVQNAIHGGDSQKWKIIEME